MAFLNFYTQFGTAANSANCTINGQPADCGKTAGIAAAFFIPLAIITLVLMVFWVISLIHLFKHKDVPNRTLWIILHFIGLSTLAGVIYFFAVKRPYDKQAALAGSQPLVVGSVPPQPGVPQPVAPPLPPTAVAPQTTQQQPYQAPQPPVNPSQRPPQV